MTLVEQEVVDRVHIEAVLGAFARCALTGEMGGLDALLTDDAVIDTTPIGGGELGRADAAAWLMQAMAPFSLVVPLVGDVFVSRDGGDNADVESTWHAAVVPVDGGAPRIAYGVTRDRFVRGSDGWRIARRTIEVGVVVEMVAPDA